MMQRSKQTVAIILDFDGTIADTFLMALNVFYELSHREPMPEEDITRLRGMGNRELMRELDIHVWQLPFWGWRARRKLAAQIDDVELIPGMADAIRKLARQYQLFVLSSNSSNNVAAVLKRYCVSDLFAGVYGNAGVLHKERRLRRLLRQNHIEPTMAWYVGDEVRDIAAGHHEGMRVMSVSWGFNAIGALQHHHPDALVFSPDELVDYFRQKRTKVE